MPKKSAIVTVHYSSLRLLESFQMMNRFKTDWDQSGKTLGENNDYPLLMTQFRTSLAQFQAGLEVDDQKGDTKALAEADALRDADFKTLRQQIKSFRSSRREQDLADYQLLDNLMKDYKAIENSNSEKETAAITTLLAKLANAPYASAVDNLGLKRFVNNLADSQTAFEKLYNNNSQAKLANPAVRLKELYDAALEDYMLLIDYTKLLSRYRTDAVITDMINTFNNSRKYYADILAQRKGKKLADKSKKTETPIEEKDNLDEEGEG